MDTLVGILMDLMGLMEGKAKEKMEAEERERHQYFLNLVVLPTVRVTKFTSTSEGGQIHLNK